jgi:hypothetical protein
MKNFRYLIINYKLHFMISVHEKPLLSSNLEKLRLEDEVPFESNFIFLSIHFKDFSFKQMGHF